MQKKRTTDVLPIPDKLIRYRQKLSAESAVKGRGRLRPRKSGVDCGPRNAAIRILSCKRRNSLVSHRGNRQFPGWNLPPLVKRDIGAHLKNLPF